MCSIFQVYFLVCFAESSSLLFEVAVAAFLFKVAVAGYYLKLLAIVFRTAATSAEFILLLF